jgi:hypothetical protein
MPDPTRSLSPFVVFLTSSVPTTDVTFLQALADQVGYTPQFVLASSLNNMIDLASMGLIGQKAGFSSTLDTQLKAVRPFRLYLSSTLTDHASFPQILEVTASALASIASSSRARAAAALANSASRKETQHEREVIVAQLRTEGVRDGRLDTVAGNGVFSELGGGIEGPAAGLEKEAGSDTKVEIVGPHSSAVVREAVEASAREQKDGEPSPGQDLERLPVVVIKGCVPSVLSLTMTIDNVLL